MFSAMCGMRKRIVLYIFCRKRKFCPACIPAKIIEDIPPWAILKELNCPAGRNVSHIMKALHREDIFYFLKFGYDWL